MNNYFFIFLKKQLFIIFTLLLFLTNNVIITAQTENKTEGGQMFKKITTNLMVKSVNKSAEFYNKHFGFQTVVTVPDSGELDFAILMRDQVELMLQKKESLGSDVPYLSNMEIGGSFTLFIEVENVEEIYNKIKSEVEILVDLKTTFYGMKEVTIKDLDGYVLTFAERVEQ